MLLNHSPPRHLIAFCRDGSKNTIPTLSQIGVVDGAASLQDGFVPLNFEATPPDGDGVPPSGLDMNGILGEIDAIVRWMAVGGGFVHDPDYAGNSAVNGYPKGARILRSDGGGYWLNTTDNNATDPEGAGALAAGWVPDIMPGVAPVAMSGFDVTLSPLQYGQPIIGISGTLTAHVHLIFPAMYGQWTVINSTTGPYSITCKTASGTGVVIDALSIVSGDGSNIRLASSSNITPINKGAIRGARNRYKMTCNGTDNNVVVSANEICLEEWNGSAYTGKYVTIHELSLTKTTDSWAAGGGNGGLDTGTINPGEWYCIWVIYNPTIQSMDILISNSNLSPAMPSGYTYRARFSYFRTDNADGYPISMTSLDHYSDYKVSAGSNLPSLRIMEHNNAYSDQTVIQSPISDFVPPTAIRIKGVALCSTDTIASDAHVWLSPSDQYSVTNPHLGVPINLKSTIADATSKSIQYDFMIEGSTLQFQATGYASLYCSGWVDDF